MTLHRSALLSGQWRQDANRALTPCHFFDLAARSEVAPIALCGLAPSSVSEATSLQLGTADYAPSRADCPACRVVIGEDPRADYARHAQTS